MQIQKIALTSGVVEGVMVVLILTYLTNMNSCATILHSMIPNAMRMDVGMFIRKCRRPIYLYTVIVDAVDRKLP